MPNESWRVPNMDANTGKFVPEEHGLIPQGTYQCLVVAFDTIKPSKARDFHAYIRIELRIVSDDEFNGRKLFTYAYGLYPAIRMILFARDAYIGETVPTKVFIKEFKEQFHNSAEITWPYPEGAKDELQD
jgi:hypothetical protein